MTIPTKNGGQYALCRNTDRRSAILTMRLSAIYHFEHSTIDEVHICNKHVRLSDFHNSDYLQVRNVIPTDYYYK